MGPVRQAQDEPFGAVLRRLRLTAGFSQAALAERAGLSERGISDLERGQRRFPHPATIRMLADALSLDESGRTELIRAGRQREPIPNVSAATAAMGSLAAGEFPIAPSPFIGRESEIEAIRLLLRQSGARLVTLTGPGGTGKTWLALRMGHELFDDYRGSVAFVPLAPVADPTHVVPAIAEALRIRQLRELSLVEAVGAALQGVRALLVLDNFEHVLDAAPALGELLRRCPDLQMLVTSRAVLHLRGERVVEVPPLDLPAATDSLSVEEAQRFSAIAMFVDRAQAARPGFSVTTANIADITAVCRRLDGLPLALELAAARMRVLAPGQLLRMLDRPLPVLTGGARDLPARHRTLRDTIAWSYDLLSDEDQALFRQLSIFTGGWTIEAASAVAGFDPLQATVPALLDRLTVLLDQSLVRGVAQPDHTHRFEMLETIREFGLDQLTRCGETDDVSARHARWAVRFVEQQGFDRVIGGEGYRLARVDQDYDNIRAALRWLLGQRATTEALTLCAALRQFWVVRGYLREGLDWLQEALALDDGTDAVARARALHAAASVACNHGDLELTEQLAGACMALYNDLANDAGIADALHLLGLAAQLRGEHEQARDLYERCVQLKRKVEHPTLTRTLGNLAQVTFHLAEVSRAVALLEECILIDRRTGNSEQLGVALTDLGLILVECGEDERAAEILIEGLQLHRELGYVRLVTGTFDGIAALASKYGQPERAVRLYGAAEAIIERIGSPRHDPEQWHYAYHVSRAHEQLGDAAFRAAWDSGRAMSLDEAIEYALVPSLIVDDGC